MSITTLIVNIFDKSMDFTWGRYGYEGVVEERDIVYNKDEPLACRLDLYRKKSEGKQPVLLNIHGGGFVAGTKEGRKGFSRYIAGLGFAVVNIAYGLSPKYQYPRNLRQAMSALKWIKDNAEAYNFDTDNVVVCGDSAGGYMAAAITGLTVNEDYRNALDIPDAGISLKGGIYYCGVYDMPFSLEQKMVFNMQNKLAREVFGLDNVDDEKLKAYKYFKEVSPINFINEKFPPLLVTHTDADVLCPKQGGRIIEKLKELKIPHWELRAAKTKCMHCWHLNQLSAAGRAALGATADFLKALLEDGIKDRYIEI